MAWLIVLAVLAGALAVLLAYDLVQHRHAILRNFPVVGHLRYLLESIGPELRQYIVTDNDEERPFSRDQRRWVYTTAKAGNNTFGFGSDNDFERPYVGYVIVKHSAFPHPPVAADHDPLHPLPAAKVLGAAHGRRLAVRPPSLVNISGMSFGSLSAAAVEALNRGAQLAGCWQSTGEGGLAPAHQHGGELVFQIGTAYFGCRNEEGLFDLTRLVDVCQANPVRAVEVKLSQGAKPGLGGLLPAAKVSPEIARIRGISVGKDCQSPAYHTAFREVDGLIDFVEKIAEATGLPVGIKSAVGESRFWTDLAARMAHRGGGVDFVTVDGGEGGTGAAPLVFTDHVALPFRLAFPRVYRTFAEAGLHHRVYFIGSGKLGFPASALHALALGCDSINVGREAMLAIGCVQAQRCHTGRCPTGVATQSAWLQHGLDPSLKSVRCATYIAGLRGELLELAHAVGVAHPALVGPEHLELLDEQRGSRGLDELVDYPAGWGLPSVADAQALLSLVGARPGQAGPPG
jgi:glutamate synthase domain-containing protein 2